MISSPSAQIVNAIAENIHISGPGGPSVPSYGPTMGVATAIIATGIVVTAALGPEKRGSHFEHIIIGQATAQEEEAKAKLDRLERGGSVDNSGNEKRMEEQLEVVDKV